MRKVFVAVAFLSLTYLVWADDLVKQGPDYFVSEPDLALNLPDTKQNYTVEITRLYSDQYTEALLRKAEAVYPKREKVLAAIEKAHFKLSQTPDTKEPLWWTSAFDGVRIPYALSAGAVAYYHTLIQSFMRGDFSGSANLKMTSAKLKYTAGIKHYNKWAYEEQRFRNVYVADLSLTWSQYCGTECAMGFEKKRLVVFDKDGNILAVFGDGNTNTEVS